MDSITISLLCIAIITIIFFSQYDIHNLNLEPKDASIILLVLAFIAYINKYEKLFLLFLGIFILIYFIPNEKINSFIKPIFDKFTNYKESFTSTTSTKKPKEKTKNKKLKAKIIEDTDNDDEAIDNIENNEITIDDQISILDDIETDNITEKIEKINNKDELDNIYLNELNKEYNT